MKNALRVALSLLVAAPAGAGLPTAKGDGQAALQRVETLAQTAQTAATLEHGNQALSRGYDLAANTPAPVTDARNPQPQQLQPAPAETGVRYVGVPPITADKEDDSAAKKKAEDEKKKKNLQRAAIGGIGGAAVLAVFGFIFGGPAGAIAMGALGFGVLAGVTYLNNNPI